MKCHQCGSTDMIEGLTVVDRGSNNKHELEIELQTAPNALVFKHGITAKVRANVCGSCGNVMLRIEPGRMSAIRGAAEGMKLLGKPGNFKNHELYKDFIKGDTARKYLSLEDQYAEFSDWIQRRSKDQKKS